MGLTFVGLRDKTGRASSVGIIDGNKARVQITGGLPHGADFTLDEFDSFALRYLETRGYDVSNVGRPANGRGRGQYVVMNVEDIELVAVFSHRSDAVAYISSELRDRDFVGVERGAYEVDGPVNFNPPSKE